METRLKWTAEEVVNLAKVRFGNSPWLIICDFDARDIQFQLLNYGLFVAQVKLEIQGMEDATGISWSILGTDCKSARNMQVDTSRQYTEHCELAVGQSYTLQCENTGDGWKTNHLFIEGYSYCMQTSVETLTTVTITGNIYSAQIMIKTFLCNIRMCNTNLFILISI